MNAALQPMSKAAFVALVTANQPEVPAYFAYAADLNRRQRSTLTQALELILTPLTLDQVVGLMNADAQVVDTRQASVYATRHLTGSLNIGLHGQYAFWAGTVLDRHRPIVLITEPGYESEATMRLGRIGFDHVAGYLAGGMDALAARPELTRQTERMTPLTLTAALASADPPLLLDVRTPQERHTRYIAGSLHIPLPRLQRQIHDVPRDHKMVVYCAGGYRSSLAVGLLEQHGITPLADLDGGMTAWADAGLETLIPEAESA
jgi:hydroxyacylglutathione hydrolase